MPVPAWVRFSAILQQREDKGILMKKVETGDFAERHNLRSSDESAHTNPDVNTLHGKQPDNENLVHFHQAILTGHGSTQRVFFQQWTQEGP